MVKRCEFLRTEIQEFYRIWVYYNKIDKGGHYAAEEHPKLSSEEVRAGLRSLRSKKAWVDRFRHSSLYCSKRARELR